MSEGQLRKIAEYLEKLGERTSPNWSYAYRGQEDASWKVVSAAHRRLEKAGVDDKFFVEYHRKEILNPARSEGHGNDNGQELNDLELLARFQHIGLATGLIDFTSNFFVALWFACHDPERDGKVFIINKGDPDIFLSLEEEGLEHGKKIEDIFNFETRKSDAKKSEKDVSKPQPKYWHWSPPAMNERILKQDSLFIFGKERLADEYLKDIQVLEQDKPILLEELELVGITGRSLFRDRQGFASTRGHDQPLLRKYEEEKEEKIPTEKSDVKAREYFRRGGEALQRGEFNTAIREYSEAINLKLDYAEAYYARGSAKVAMREDEDAIADFNQAITHKLNYAEAYFFRGLAEANSERYSDAIADFEKAIECKKEDYADAWCGLGTVKLTLKQYEEAIVAYKHAVRLKSGAENYFDLGNAKFLLGEYEATKGEAAKGEAAKGEAAKGDVDKAKSLWSEAVKDLNKAISLDKNCPLAHFVRAKAKLKLGDKEGAREDYAREQELAKRRGESETVEAIKRILSDIDNQAPNK